MLDVVIEINQDEETNSLMEDVEATDNEENQNLTATDGKQALKEITKYYDKQQQLELVLATQELFEFGDHELGHTEFDEEETCEMDTRSIDIWKDATCLGLLKKDTTKHNRP
jgi:hypothetical protein